LERIMEQPQGLASTNQVDRKRVEAVVETLATAAGRGDSLAEVAHDARNMVTALGLYCDLLEEPGVLGGPFTHYSTELRLVAAASRRLVEKLVALDSNTAANAGSLPGLPKADTHSRRQGAGRGAAQSGWDLMPATLMANFGAELLANHNLLAALAGPGVNVTVDVEGGARPVRMTGEDLTRVLVNLVKNASEAMPAGGRIQIELRQLPAAEGECLSLTVTDSGTGIPADSLDKIFAAGYTTRAGERKNKGGWASAPRGLGLSIVRSIVEGAGGRIRAGNRPRGGACIEIELPVRMA
jgi:signal transduction histidine kinase